MTILEELIDLALKCCENSRTSGQRHNARGAAMLDASGKVYTGCDVYMKENDPNAIFAEKAAMIAAISDGMVRVEVSDDQVLARYLLSNDRY
jgi:cytidine deaminase